MNKRYVLPFFLGSIAASSNVFADGTAIDKVYHPYVQANEREVEWRAVAASGNHKQRLGYGQAVNDNLFLEGYLLAAEQNNNFSLTGYEAEAKWQLTEQGEYAFDWGFITELEIGHQSDKAELASALLVEKEWQRWVGTANLWLKYEKGNQIHNEWETALAMQMRYLLSPKFEPAVEFYAGQNTRALGPVMMGEVRLAPGKKLHWETGVLLGLDNNTPDANIRLLAEYEF